MSRCHISPSVPTFCQGSTVSEQAAKFGARLVHLKGCALDQRRNSDRLPCHASAGRWKEQGSTNPKFPGRSLVCFAGGSSSVAPEGASRANGAANLAQQGPESLQTAPGTPQQQQLTTADPPASSAPASLRSLYPPIESHKQGYLKVSDLHTVYYEVFGNPNGVPVVFLHGGPGAGCYKNHARFFDPTFYRVVLFDQRGCGKSTPRGCLLENDTWHLVGDMEKLREELHISSWLVFGGSWGTTLGLAYAHTHPERVSAMVLRGVCLLRQQELDWFYRQGASALYPFGWRRLLSVIPPEGHSDLISAFYRRLTCGDAAIEEAAASAWARWEMGLSFTPKTPLLISWDGTEYTERPFPESLEGSSQRPWHKRSGMGEGGGAGEPDGCAPSASQSQQGETAAMGAGSAGQDDRSLVLKNGPESEEEHERQLRGRQGMGGSLVQARIEAHYFFHKGFLEEGQLLRGMGKLRNVPGIIVHGRHDHVCTVGNAVELHLQWPEAELRIVPNAGHSMYEPGITHELVEATDLLRLVL